jgi:hypothetical protein
VSGWLVALPLTSGPIVFFLSLSLGDQFAATVAMATLAGAVSQAAFCLMYCWLALRWKWPYTLLSSCLVFLASTLLLQRLLLPVVPLFLFVILVLVLTLRLMPPLRTVIPLERRSAPQWDIPIRIAVTTLFVLLLTGSAPRLGPQLTGLLAPFPLYGALLAVFAHHQSGALPAVQVLRGLLFGLFSFAGFFLILGLLLEPVATGWAFGAAIAGALIIQAGTLWLLRWQAAITGAERLLEKP